MADSLSSSMYSIGADMTPDELAAAQAAFTANPYGSNTLDTKGENMTGFSSMNDVAGLGQLSLAEGGGYNLWGNQEDTQFSNTGQYEGTTQVADNNITPLEGIAMVGTAAIGGMAADGMFAGGAGAAAGGAGAGAGAGADVAGTAATGVGAGTGAGLTAGANSVGTGLGGTLAGVDTGVTAGATGAGATAAGAGGGGAGGLLGSGVTAGQAVSGTSALSGLLGSALGGSGTSGLLGSAGGLIAGGLTASALNNGNASAQTAANTANPFQSQYAGYQQQLQGLMTNPNSFQQSAESQALTQQGMAQTNAQMGASGLFNSGAQEAALTNLATTNAGTNYNSQITQLEQLSGANTSSPATAGQILQNQNTANSKSAAAAGSAVGGLVGNAVGTGLNGLLNSGASSGLSGANTATGVGTSVIPQGSGAVSGDNTGMDPSLNSLLGF